MAIIYALCDPLTKAVRYIGKTNCLTLRLKSHKSEKRQTRKCRWFALLRAKGLEPTVKVLQQVRDDNWQEAERFWISKFRADGCDLCNHTDGGEGLCGMDGELRQRIAAITRKRMADPKVRAKIYTKERAAKISTALKGKRKSPEHVANLPQNRSGKKLSPDHRAALVSSNGHRWSPEEIARIRVMNIGNKYGLGNRSRTGMRMSDADKLRRSLALRGRPKPEAHKEKIRQAQLASWARRKSMKGTAR